LKIWRNWVNWIKIVFGYLKFSLFLIITTTVLLEIIFMLLPTSDSLKTQPVTAEDKIVRYKKDRDVTRQLGFNFQHVTIKHINNYGYASDKDYQNKHVQTKRVVAVIGDSYVDAVQVKTRDAFHAVLDEDLENFDVYPIGINGSQLSQYLAFSSYAAEEFDPALYVFLIIYNDFDQSFFKYKKSKGFHYFNEDGELNLVEYQPSLLTRLARNSAFIRYLHIDLKIALQLQRIFKGRDITNSLQPKKKEEFLRTGRLAIDKFLIGVKQLTENSKVVLLLDGDRNSIYKGMQQRDITVPSNILFEELKLLSKGIPNVDVVDLHNLFLQDWVNNNTKFNFDYDYHWNEYGHSIAARALLDKINELKL